MKNKLLTTFEVARLLLLAPILVAIPTIQHCFMVVVCLKDGSPVAAKKYRKFALEALPTAMSLWMVYLMIYILISFIGGR